MNINLTNQVKTNKIKQLFTIATFILFSNAAFSQISGTVFRDFNGNGTKDANEPLVSGVNVNVYNTTGALCGTTSSAGNTAPNYSIPSACSGALRVEFVMPTSSNCVQAGIDFSSLSGKAYGSSTQFVTAPTTTVNYALMLPGYYKTDSSNEVFASKIVPDGPSGVLNDIGLVGWDYRNYQGNAAMGNGYAFGPTYAALSALHYNTGLSSGSLYIGNIWGLAYSSQAKKLFGSAVLARNALTGDLGVGGIYLLNPSSTNKTIGALPFFNMDNNSFNTSSNPLTYTSSDTTQGPNYGNGSTFNLSPAANANTVTFPDLYSLGVVGTNTERGIINAFNPDPAAFGQVGKVGIGGIDLSDDGKYLFVVNLFQRKLYRLTLNDAYNPTGVTAVSSYSLPPVTANNGVLRPWAVKYYRGNVYVGAVATAENGGTIADEVSYVFKLSNAENSAYFETAPLLTIPMNYTRNTAVSQWLPWTDSNPNADHQPQPILSSIDFTDNGDMVLGYLDRLYLQEEMQHNTAYLNNTTNAGASTGYGETLIAGIGGNCNGVFNLENNGSIVSVNGTTITALNNSNGSLGPNDGAGIGGGQFITGDNYSSFVEQSQGSLAVIPGIGKFIEATRNSGAANNGYNYNGTKLISTITGQAIDPVTMLSNPNVNKGYVLSGVQGKGNVIGDIEFLTPEAPIEIGNRVWNDVNGNGIQDAGEAGIAGVVVNLYAADGSTLIGTVTTDANGNYYFSNATGTNATGIKYFNGATTATTGLIPKTAYVLKIGATSWASGAGIGSLLSTPFLTNANSTAGAGVQDEIDNDGSIVSTVPTINITTGSSGSTDHSYDFGFSTTPLSLGNYVWNDINKDGIQDNTEVGVAGITVTLYNTSNVVIATTITDAYGYYKFSPLEEGTYKVGFTLPANYVFTTKDGATTDATDSDVDPMTGLTTTYTLVNGDSNMTVDAGIIFAAPTTATVGDRVWYDANNNGVQDATEIGVSGVVVTLLDNAGNNVGTAITDVNGNYLFTEVVPGNYAVKFNAPMGSTFTTNSDIVSSPTNSDANVSTGISPVFTVLAGDAIKYVDAGIVLQASTKASLGDKVWNDANLDGIQSSNEPGIPGVVVNLYAGNGTTLLSSTVTDAFGNYSFNNLDSGAYVVEFVKPTNFDYTTPLVAGSTIYNNSDANISTGKTAVIVLNPGDRNSTIDAGLIPTNTLGTLMLGDKVWFDNNKDGVQGSTESGIGGVTVVLYLNGIDGLSGTADDIKVGQTVTDINGNYIFVNLDASVSASTEYNVLFKNIPEGYSFTTTMQTANGGTTTTDSNPFQASGRTASINLVANDLTIDAGLVQGLPAGTASLGDKVFTDLNNNGLQDANEVGVSGAVVKLYKDANNDGVVNGVELTPIATTTTNALGNYIFTGLAAGTYQVGFSSLPAGFTTSTKDEGTNDETDSDGNPTNTTTNGNPATPGTSFTNLIALAIGQDNLSVDLGLVPPVNTNTLGDYVWFDANNDGLQSAGEIPMKGVMVTLYNNAGIAIDNTVTNEYGKYLFTGLADGTYHVGFSNLPTGFALTTQSGSNTTNGSDANTTTGLTTTVTLNAGNRNDATLDAGLVSTKAGLGNYVWIDENKNGIQDATELPISGATVTLYAPSVGLDGIAGNADDALPVATCITDANGLYYFGNLNAGTYQVGFSTLPSGYNFTVQNNIGDNQDNTNSDANPNTGLSSLITLSAKEFDMTIDAGIAPKNTATVGDYVWYDPNRNGLQDATEVGVAGVQATLYNASNVEIGTAITDGNGKYLITNVPAGTGYYVKFNANITGFSTFGKPTWTTPNVGVNGAGTGSSTESNLDSDPVNTSGPLFGITGAFTVVDGDNIRNVDAGIYTPITLQGNVWHDVNGNTDNLVNNSGAMVVPAVSPIPVGLRAYLVNPTTNLIEKIAIVSSSTGTFNFGEISPSTNYYIILSKTPSSVGTLVPAASLPSGWKNTGEKLGITTGSDGIVNGRLNVPGSRNNIINANFGIRLKNGEAVIP